MRTIAPLRAWASLQGNPSRLKSTCYKTLYQVDFTGKISQAPASGKIGLFRPSRRDGMGIAPDEIGGEQRTTANQNPVGGQCESKDASRQSIPLEGNLVRGLKSRGRGSSGGRDGQSMLVPSRQAPNPAAPKALMSLRASGDAGGRAGRLGPRAPGWAGSRGWPRFRPAARARGAGRSC